MAKFSAGGQSRQERSGIQLPGFATQGVVAQQRGPTTQQKMFLAAVDMGYRNHGHLGSIRKSSGRDQGHLLSQGQV